MPRIPLLELSDFDFTSVGKGQSVLVPIRQALDVQMYGAGTVSLRGHLATLPAGASVRLELRGVAPTPQDPTAFFRGPLLAVAELTASGTAQLVTAYARLWSGQVGVFLRATQGSGGGTFTFTISAELDCQPHPNRWTPLELGGRLTLWLDQHDQVVASDDVSDWGDQSSAGNDFLMYFNPSRRPAYGKSINSLDAPTFDGSIDYLELASAGPSSLILSVSGFHIFTVVRFDSITLNSGSPYQNHVIFGDLAAAFALVVGTPGVQASQSDGSFCVTPPIPVATNTNYLIEYSFDGATVRCRVGSGVPQTVASGAIVSLAAKPLLGHGEGSSGYLAGSIGSMVVSNKYLKAAEAQNVRAYLSSVYGVPA